MNKAGTYLPSLVVSVLLVFALLAGSALTLVDINVTADSLKSLAEKHDLSSKIYSDVNNYYTAKYNTTGIPADVYMSAIDETYLREYEEAYIDAAFSALNSDGKFTIKPPSNKKLEENIDKFFNDFADEHSYEKDDSFGLKLRTTKENAFSTIGSYCDVYKFSTMSEHGVLQKLARIYSNRIAATGILLFGIGFLILLLITINHKKKITAMYWCGISAIVSGLLGSIPSIYLTATRYYDSFSIKQATVFTAFTSIMYRLTEAFIAVQLAFVVIGISLVVIYGIVHEKKKYPDTKPTDI